MKKILKKIRKNIRIILVAVYSVAFIFFFAYLSRRPEYVGQYLYLKGIAAYLIGIVLIVAITHKVSLHGMKSKDRSHIEKSIYDSVKGINTPVIISDENEKIVWCNEYFQSVVSDISSPYGKSVSDVLGVTVDEIRTAPEYDGIAVQIGEHYFIAKCGTLQMSRSGEMIILTESSELKTMSDELELIHERIEKTETVVSYIVVDNLTEIVQYDNESYRPASARINEILHEWADDAHGILKEYERDRYLFLFEKESLLRYMEKKFDILDRIRDIRIGKEQLSVTISVGIAAVWGTFDEKEKAARSALELALGRGGDQVVVKDNEGTEFFGGKTKASNRRNLVRSRVVSNELLMLISRSSNVLIMGHRYPDFDAIGSCVGVARIAMFCGVDVNIVTDPDDKNVAICRKLLADVPEYDRIFITADKGLDMIHPDTLLIICDVSNLSIVESRDITDNVSKFAVIDHHRKVAEYPNEPVLEYIDTKSSSACELVSEIMEQILPQGTVLPAEANLLLSGIMLDTRQFSRMTGSRTYAAVLYLHECGASPQITQDMFREDLDEYRKEGIFRSNVVIYRMCTAITICDEGKDGASSASEDKIMASKAAENLIKVKNIKAAFAIVTIGDVVHISARSSGEINVQLILEKLSGGGHFDTAGAQITGATAQETIVRLKNSIDEYLDSIQ